MKITLNLSHEAITIVTATLQPLYNTKAYSKRDKSTLSIAMDVLAKLEAKFGNAKLKTDLFNTKKKLNIIYKYHEAHVLEAVLIQEIKDVSNAEIRRMIQLVIDQLNQKLA